MYVYVYDMHLIMHVCNAVILPSLQAYGVRHYSCVAGVQVTASHNPKEYNGYKVYWDNGAQIIPPHDVGIATQIEAHLVPWENSWCTDVVKSSSLVSDPLGAIEKSYYHDIQKHCLRSVK